MGLTLTTGLSLVLGVANYCSLPLALFLPLALNMRYLRRTPVYPERVCTAPRACNAKTTPP